MFDVAVISVSKEKCRFGLPFIPRRDEHIMAPDGNTYIVEKVVYDLSEYREKNDKAIQVKIFARRKTDRDY